MKQLFGVFLLAGGLLFAGIARAQDSFRIPALTGPVIDEVGMMTRGDQRRLEQVLRDYNQQGRAQIQVLIVPNLGGLTLEEASIRVFDKWQLGQKKKDNGILFLVAAEERRLRFEVGRGLEGAIPDVTAKRIQEDQIIPLFRAGRPSAGIMVGVSEILRLVDGETAGQALAKEEKQDFDGWILIAVFFIFILIQILRVASGSPLRGRGGPWIGGGGGGWGGGSGWGGGGGGGWSGGGGSSAGGGASSGW